MDYSAFDIRKYPTLGVQDGYKEWANTYERSVEDEMDLRLLNRSTSIHWSSIHQAIDLACGTGRIGSWLHQQGVKEIDGIDFTEEMLKKAEARKVYRKTMLGNILDTQLSDAQYDLAIQVLADEHLSDLKPLYGEATRMIKPGGYFVIVGYHPHFLMNGLVTHFHRKDGEAIAIESYVHLLSDHVKAAYMHHLRLLEMDEGIVDEDWLNKKPKWERYKHRPVSFMYIWQK